MPKRATLTDAQIDALVAGTSLGRTGNSENPDRSLSAAREYLTGRAPTMAAAGAAVGVSKQSVRTTVQSVIKLAERDDSGRELVRVLLPPEHRPALRAWLGRKGGDIVG